MKDAPFVSVAHEYLFWLPYALAMMALIAVVCGAAQAYKAVVLWSLRDVPISDPIIAKALEGVKPPRYWLRAIACFALAGLAAFGCYDTLTVM